MLYKSAPDDLKTLQYLTEPERRGMKPSTARQDNGKVPLPTDHGKAQLQPIVKGKIVPSSWQWQPPIKCPASINNKLTKITWDPCDPHKEKGKNKCPLTCLDIVNGRRAKMEDASRIRNVIMTDAELKTLATNCDDLFVRGKYANEVGTDEEMNFPLAYSILVYKDAGQVEMLLRSIYQPNNAYCFHIDQKASAVFKEAMKEMVKCFPNVVISNRSVRVMYASFSRLYADILCMRELVQSPHKWKYLINLAGTAMPLKTNWEIVQVLSMYNKANDIEGLMPNQTIKERFSHKWIVSNVTNDTNRIGMVKTNITKSPPPHNLNIIRGSAYGSFSRGFINYVLNDRVAKDFLDWSMDTYSPDEHYWATLHHLYYNPHLRTPGGFKGPAKSSSWITSYSSWPMEEPCLGQALKKTSPCILGLYAFPDLNQRPEFFVNKFSRSFEPLAQYCLSAAIQFRTLCQKEFDVSHYQKFPIIKDEFLVQR